MHPYLSKAIYNIAQAIRGQNVSDHLKRLEETQWYTAEELKNLQWQSLKKLLQHAYENTPYYRKQFEKLGLCPEDIDSPEAFRKLPFLTKDDIRDNFSDLKARNIKCFLDDHTTGSTGSPLHFLKERSTSGHFLASQYRGHRWYDIDIGDRMAKFWGLPLDQKDRWIERVKDFMLNRTRFVVFDISKETILKDFEICKRRRPKYLYGYAGAVYRFARLLQEEGLDGSILNLKGVITTSEVLCDYERELIRAVFGCPVISEYGACEAGVIAFDCPKGNMHVSVENVYLEILDKNGQPAAYGDSGEIVITQLNNYAMPFIRYKIGDLAKCISEEERCECGRGLPLIGEITGRTSDTMVTPTGNLVHPHLFTYIFYSLISRGADIRGFKIIQKAPYRLLIKLEASRENAPEYENFITEQVVEFMGKDVSIEFEYAESIPPEASGKFRYFASEIDEYKKSEGR